MVATRESAMGTGADERGLLAVAAPVCGGADDGALEDGALACSGAAVAESAVTGPRTTICAPAQSPPAAASARRGALGEGGATGAGGRASGRTFSDSDAIQTATVSKRAIIAGKVLRPGRGGNPADARNVRERYSPRPMRSCLLLVIYCLACAKSSSPPACVAPSTLVAGKCTAPTRHYTFKAIAGVSMGAVGSSRLVAAHPERFDAAGFLGGPLDATLLLHTMEVAHLGGFCTPLQLEQALALDLADGGNRLDRPDGIPGCTPANVAVTHDSRPRRFNHFAFTTNGGHFDRDAYLDIFRDLTLAIGNPFSQSSDSPALPAGITAADFTAATCDSPKVIPHVIHPLYSPHGEHSAITFCDGEPPLRVCADGTLVDWCAAAALGGRKLAVDSDQDAFCAAHGGSPREVDQHADADLYYAHKGDVQGCYPGRTKVTFALAIDLNGNGRRDYQEPVMALSHEPFSDFGKDGCPDALEDGNGGCTDAAHSPFAQGIKDPNGDNYDALKNPLGTENNWRWDPGEPFEDTGLDGVAGTHDQGEGDGKFTLALGAQRWFDGDLRLHLPPKVDLYVEGGIRDVFDLGAQAEAVGGAVPGARSFADFFSIPSTRGSWNGTFDPLQIDLTALGSNPLVTYGNPTATPQQIRDGDGDHVGSAEEAYDRFLVFFRWLSGRWDAVVPDHGSRGTGTTKQLVWTSTVLGAQQDFAVSLPPDYDSNPTKRYPVLLLLHGYGQGVQDFSGTSVFIDTLANTGNMRGIIVVYPSGRCCLTGPHGERTCRDADDNGVNYDQQGYVRECARGSFYSNRSGLTGADNTRYGDALLELMDVVDKSYRTLAPADGPAY
jgi:hypothetical protein